MSTQDQYSLLLQHQCIHNFIYLAYSFCFFFSQNQIWSNICAADMSKASIHVTLSNECYFIFGFEKKKSKSCMQDRYSCVCIGVAVIMTTDPVFSLMLLLLSCMAHYSQGMVWWKPFYLGSWISLYPLTFKWWETLWYVFIILVCCFTVRKPEDLETCGLLHNVEKRWNQTSLLYIFYCIEQCFLSSRRKVTERKPACLVRVKHLLFFNLYSCSLVLLPSSLTRKSSLSAKVLLTVFCCVSCCCWLIIYWCSYIFVMHLWHTNSCILH